MSTRSNLSGQVLGDSKFVDEASPELHVISTDSVLGRERSLALRCSTYTSRVHRLLPNVLFLSLAMQLPTKERTRGTDGPRTNRGRWSLAVKLERDDEGETMALGFRS
jgi:hypothetical protein